MLSPDFVSLIPANGVRSLPRNETEVLLHCLNCAVTPEFVRALPESLDWRKVLHLAERLDTTTLLFTQLAKTGAHLALPFDCSRTLLTAHIGSTARSVRLQRDLTRLVASLAAAGIPVVLLKGAALATAVYDDFPLRPMGDIDLLVERPNVDGARECLLKAGYLPDESAEWYRANHHHEQPFLSIDKHVTIELHVHIVPPRCSFRIPVEELWERARPVRVGDSAALVLSPEDLIIHTAVHIGSIHLLKGQLKGLIDIAAIARRFEGNLRWPRLVELAVGYGAVLDVYHCLLLARDYAGAEVPAETLRELRAASPCTEFETRLANQLFRRVVVNQEEGFVPTGLIQETCGILLSPKGSWQKLRAVTKYVCAQYVADGRARCRLPMPFLIPYLLLIYPAILLRERLSVGGHP